MAMRCTPCLIIRTTALIAGPRTIHRGLLRVRPRQRWTQALTSVAFYMVALDALVVTVGIAGDGPRPAGGMTALQWTVDVYGPAHAAGRDFS